MRRAYGARVHAMNVVQTDVILDGVVYTLASAGDPKVVRDAIESAVATEGTFVDITVEGNATVSILVTSHSRVQIVTRTVTTDAGDIVLTFPEIGEAEML